MRRRGRTRTTRPMGRRTNLRPKSINLPGLGIEDIDIEEIIGRPAQARGKKGPFGVSPPTPTNPEDQQMVRDMASKVFFGGGSRKNTGETINIPGVGRVQLPTSQSSGSVPQETPSGKPIIKGEFPNPFANETDPNLSELDRLKNQYDMLTGMRFIRDPGPGHFNKIKELAQQIYGLDNTFESPYLQTETQPVETQPETAPTAPTAPTPTGSYESSYIDWLESKPEKPTVRRLGRMPGGGPAYKRAQKKYREDLASWKASKPTRDSFTAPTPTPRPVETLPVETPLPVEDKPKPPTSPPVNPFEGFVPRNILAPSFDPKDVSAQQKMVADARARQTPGANIQGGGYLTYDNPILGNKQTQFGGYGQPMPTAPLMNYAGLSSPITYSTLDPDPDAQPGGPPPPKPPFF